MWATRLRLSLLSSDVDGIATLSRKKIENIVSWRKIVAAYEAQEILEGKIEAAVKGGVLINLFGLRVFIPASHTGVPKDGDISALVGTTQRVKIIEINESRRRAVASIRVVAREERKKLVEVTRESVQRGLAAVKPWGTLCDMAAAVQECVEENGFSVVREFGGHGIGLDFHEDPFVGFTVESPDVDTLLVPGMCFTIEPMVNAGAPDIFIDEKNGWIVHTKDGSDSAQWEVQLVVTEDGYELLSW